MTPARLLAPAALVAAAVALFVVVTSGSGDKSASSASPTPTASATVASKPKPKPTASAKTYTVKPGDTPSGIAAKLNVSVDDLLAANPDADPNALTVGAELKIP